MNKSLIQTGFIPKDGYQLYAKHIIQFPNDPEVPVLVFMHDSWGCVEMWEDFPEKLMEISQYNALVYDRRGYGKSSPATNAIRLKNYLKDEADELIQLLDFFGIEKAILYGHSDGATIATIAAAHYPERISGLILEGTHSFVEDYGRNSVRDTRDRAKNTSLVKTLEKFHGNKTAELFRLWHETWLGKEFDDWSIVNLLPKIICPVLCYQGDADEYGTVEQLNIIKKEVAGNTTVAEITNAKHTPHKEAEEETLKLIKEFIKQNF